MGSTDDVLVDPDWIAARLDDPRVRIIEVDVSPAAYDSGHIPGAVLWNAYGDLRGDGYAPIDTGELASVLARSGVTPDSTVVFYGYGAHLGFWLMKRHGHGDARVMDGARERWERAGGQWSTNAPAPAPSDYPLTGEPSEIDTSIDQLLADGDTHRRTLDVRSQDEFDGGRFWPSGATAGAGRAGHIPGAAHVPFDDLRDPDGDFKRPEGLRRILEAAGIGPDEQVVTYCTIGNRAAQVWFALTYLLDRPDAGVYYGSWAEWGTRTDTPIET